MAIELTCMNCWSQVPAEDRDRGRTISCPVCDAEVRVTGDPPPSDAAGADAAPAPAAPTPAAPVAKAAPPVAKPVMATPVKPAPAASKPAGAKDDVEFSFSDGGGGAKRPARRDEDEDEFEDDEEDDTPRRRPKTSGKKVLLLALAAVGGMFLVCAGVVGYFVWSVKTAVEDVAEHAKQAEAEILDEMKQAEAENQRRMQQNGAGKGNAATQAGKTVPRSEWSKPWAPTSNELGAMFHRFIAQMPAGAKQSGDGDPFGKKGKSFLTIRYTATEAGVEYRAESTSSDAPPDAPLQQSIAAKLPPGAAVQSGPRPATVGGQPGFQFEVKHPGRVVETIQAAQVGPGRQKSVNVVVFSVKYDPDEVRRYEGLDVEAKKREFFAGVRLLYKPDDLEPPKSSPRSKDVTAARPPTTSPPPTVTPPTPPPLPGSGGLRYVTKIDPFAAAVALADGKEVLTFSAPGAPAPGSEPQRGGVVRRYSAESFKQLGSFTLPNAAVYAAAADEKGGRLYLLVGRTSGKTGSAPVGELRVFDLKAFTAGGDAPKPTATVPLGGMPAGLDVAPDGKAVYAAAVTAVPSPRARAGRSKVLKIDPQTAAPAGEADVPAVVTTVRASPDGKFVFVGDRPPPAAGPAGGGPSAANVHVLDAAGWKRLYSVPVANGVVTDIQFVANDKAVVGSAGTGNAVKLYLVDAAGEATDLPTPLRFATAGFLAVTPDRKRLVAAVLASPGQSGTEVFAVQGAAVKPAASAPLAPGGLLTGPVVLTGDARHAVYSSGVVLDISAAEMP